MISDEEINNIISKDGEESDAGLLKKACTELMGSFDTVHIFATRHEVGAGGTVHCHYGAGNYYARYGQIREWILRQEVAMKERYD